MYECQYFDNKKHGKGRIIWKNGSLYDGYFYMDYM